MPFIKMIIHDLLDLKDHPPSGAQLGATIAIGCLGMVWWWFTRTRFYRSYSQSGGSGKLGAIGLMTQGIRFFFGRIPDPEKGTLSNSETEFFQRVLVASLLGMKDAKRVRPYYPQHHVPVPWDQLDGKSPIDGEAYTLDGDETTLMEALNSVGALEAENTILMFGSYTCPVMRMRSKQVLELAQVYQIPLVFVYITEAHVNDGWQLDTNRKAGLEYEYPKVKRERINNAKTLAHTHLGIDMGLEVFGTNGVRVVVDNLELNTLDQAYEALPVRLYTLKNGKFSWRSGPGPFQCDMKGLVEAVGLSYASVGHIIQG